MNEDCWMKDKCNRIDCNRFCMRKYKLGYLYEQAGISPKQRTYIGLHTDADGGDNEAFMKLKNIENNIGQFVANGSNLYIYSPFCGNGKTSWALRLVGAYFDSIWSKTGLKCRALFINVPKFLIALKDNIGKSNEYAIHIKNEVSNCDIAVWDDIGTKVATSFEHENLLSMIDARINEGKSNIYTSNLGGNEIQTVLGDRLASRIINDSLCVGFVGADKRGL